jgi:hypothetical protein
MALAFLGALGQRSVQAQSCDGHWVSTPSTQTVSASVHAFAVYHNQVIAGGNFLLAGPAIAEGVARWDGSSWQRLGT